MSTPVGANGENFAYPTDQEVGYASQATGWAQAVTAALDAIGRGGSTSVNPKAVIDMISTSKGLLIPRMTTVQIAAIASPPESLLVYDTTQRVFKYYRNSAWVSVGSFIEGNLDVNGNIVASGTGSFTGALSALSLAITNAITAASATLTGAFQALTGNFTDATDATNSTTAPLKTAGGVGVAKKLFVGTDLGVGGNATITGNANVTGDGNITGKILTGNGLVGAPTHSFINDPDSGLYRISENKIGFAANGIRQGEFGVGYGGFAGNIIQVLSVVKSDTFTTNNTSYTDVPNLNISITPRYNNSKILLLVDIGGFTSIGGGTSNMRLLRDATEIYSGDGANGVLNQVHDGGSTQGEHYFSAFHHGSSFLDSPNTLSTIIYKIQVKSNGGYSTVLNRSAFDSGTLYNGRTASSITVLEVQQ